MGKLVAYISAAFLSALFAWFCFDQYYIGQGHRIEGAWLLAQMALVFIGAPAMLLVADCNE